VSNKVKTPDPDREAFELEAAKWALPVTKMSARFPYYRNAQTIIAWIYWQAALAYAKRKGGEG
jgi:hypothetical protein